MNIGLWIKKIKLLHSFFLMRYCIFWFISHGIDVQAGEKKLLVLAYSTLHNTTMTELQHLLAPTMQEPS